MTSVTPGSAARIGNEYHKAENEFLFARADAMRAEYKAIVGAGSVPRLDDPPIAETGTRSTENRRSRITALHHAPRRSLSVSRIRD